MSSLATSPSQNIISPPAEAAVYDRYAQAAGEFEPALCCPVQYSKEFLEVIPDEIIQKDYGCGDPRPYVRPGETVLDLGSGGGKLCYIAAQVVGRDGQVTGIDCKQECSISLASMLPRWPSNSAMPTWSFVTG